MGLGPYPVISLADARRIALENRRLALLGDDPLAARRELRRNKRVPTFGECAARTIEAIAPQWRHPKTEVHWRQTMETYVLPFVGKKPIDQIGQRDVLRILKPVWTSKPETGRRVRGRMSKVFKWAKANGYLDQDNPAGEAIHEALPKMPAVRAHLRALPYPEVAVALATVEESNASEAVKFCFRFLILTAARSGEARGARWTEIDLARRMWIIPGERMKSGREHRVPLSTSALDVLQKARSLGVNDLVFPSPLTQSQLSNMTLTKLLRDIGMADRATVHGFRSSFRDWCAETNKPRQLAEAALAHQVHGVEAAYFRSDLFDRRRELMQEWAEYIVGAEKESVE